MRDEKKQDDMRKKYNDAKLKFYIGDVRDYDSILNASRGVDYIYHSENQYFRYGKCLRSRHPKPDKTRRLSSTDKAVYPINAMGISKAMMEKVIIAKSRNLEGTPTTICCTRYGNVMASRGSVIPLFVDQIRQGKPFTITDPEMTRFMMTLEDAVDLVLYAFKNGQNGDVFVQKAPAATIGTLAKAITELLSVPNHPISIIGTRHGEKAFEALLSREEMVHAINEGNYYRIPANQRSLNYSKYVEKGEPKITEVTDYNSHNTERLTVKEMKQLLLKLEFIQKMIEGEYISPEV